MRSRQTSRGFTLIDLMIAVGIVAVLATLAYPSYVNQVRKSRRTDAKSLLLAAANRQERTYSTSSPNTYAADMTTLGYAMNPQPTGETGTVADAWYLVSVVSPTAACPIASCYVIQAVPRRDQTKDTRCGTLRIDSLGRKTETGTADVNECW